MSYTAKQIGDLGEGHAVHYLRLRGYTVKERNWRAGKYEIDIIAATLFDIAFVEVKTRCYTKDEIALLPPPGIAVDAEKQRFTRSAALSYLRKHPTKKQPRMDVIEVWLIEQPNGKKPKLYKINHMRAAY
ncbi:MAG: YraN family protein [Clostridia bacterium]|nr:YraN family protein [Clostridia bacterium]